MANICDFLISIRCPEDQAAVIREAIEAALEEVERSAFGLILQSQNLADYPPWDRRWTGIFPPLTYEDRELRIGGSCKWDPPVWLGGYLSLHCRVPVLIGATIEHETHEEWRINLHDPNDPEPILKWEEYDEEIQYPVLRYRYREGKPVSPEAEAAVRFRLPEDILAGLPEAKPEWLSGEGLDAATVLARYFGSHRQATPEEIETGRPSLEYLVLGQFGTDLVAIRQWGGTVQVTSLDGDLLIHAHPPLARDAGWTPRTWGEIRAEWLAAGVEPRELGEKIFVNSSPRPTWGGRAVGDSEFRDGPEQISAE